MLLQVLDDGYLTDSLGRKIDFRNTIIIMTSNIGARQIKDFGTGVGFGTAAKKSQEDEHTISVIQNSFKKTFAPEFLNRIDDFVIFNALEKKHINEIIKIELQVLVNRINDLGYSLKLSKKAIDFIYDKGFDRQFGARPLNRALQKHIEDVVAEEILAGNLSEGDCIKFDWDGKSEKLSLSVSSVDTSSSKSKKS